MNNAVNDLFDFEVSGQFILLINTTSRDDLYVTWFGNQVPLNPTELRIHADGEMKFAGVLTISGNFDMLLNNDKFYLSADALFNIVSLINANISLDMLITSDGVTAGAEVLVDTSVLEIIKIYADGDLEINTVGYQVELNGKTYDPYSFLLDLYGDVSILEVLRFESGFKVQINGGAFSHDAVSDPKAAQPTGVDAYLDSGKWAVRSLCYAS